MPGQNAFAFNGTAFVPTDRNLTASLSAFSPAPTRKGVARAYQLVNGSPAQQFWQGFPSTPSNLSFRNERTGIFPNLVNSIWLDWEAAESTIIASFDVFLKIDSGNYNPIANVGAAVRTYNYGPIEAGKTYSFYVRCNGSNGLTATSQEASTSLPAATPPTNLRETSVSPTSLTWTWDFTAGVFQRFYVYRWNGSSYVYNTEVLPTQVATSATHTWSSLSENSSYQIAVAGQNYDGFWSTQIFDTASTSNADPLSPSLSASATDVTSEPAGNTNTTASATRFFALTVDPWDDPLFAEVYLEVSSNNTDWSAVTSWDNNTTSKPHTYSVTVTADVNNWAARTGQTRYFRARQRDTNNQYSAWVYSGAVTSDVLDRTYVASSYWTGTGSVGNDWIQGQNLGVTSWAVTSTFNDNTLDYGGDQAFDGDSAKSWRSKSVTNARIRITFPISGNWVNGISGVEFWPAAAYNTYVQLSSDGGTTWIGSGSTPGTGQPYVEYISSSNISPNTLNTIDINPDRYIYNKTTGVDSPGTSPVSWAVRLEFTATTARTFEVNQINVKQLRQNAVSVDNSYYRYW